MSEFRYDWEQMLDDTFQALEPDKRLIHYATIIMYVTRELLPRLSDERRREVLKMLEVPGMNDTKLAEMIGSRRTAIQRLATEGRRRLREQSGVDEPTPP
jgi:hypothetical protein